MLTMPAVEVLSPSRPATPRRPLAGAAPTTVAPASLTYRVRRQLLSGRIAGAEAQTVAPERRVLMPNAAAIRAGSRERRGGWMLERACREAAAWAGGGVAVPVGPLAGDAQRLPERVAMALEQSGLDPERLELLFVERLVAGADDDLLLALAAIRDLGVGLAFDEFGADVGNLSTLRRLPMTALKLSRGLVRGLPGDREEAAVARAVIAAAQAHDLMVGADGVDSEGQLAFLAGCGCDYGQGALFGPPLSGAEMGRAS